MPSRTKSVLPTEVQALRDEGQKLTLLDVREPDEVGICRIAGAVHIPMNDVPKRIAELDPAAPTVVYCHHGMRSQMVANFLASQGFADVSNLTGGIDLYAATVEPGMPRY